MQVEVKLVIYMTSKASFPIKNCLGLLVWFPFLSNNGLKIVRDFETKPLVFPLATQQIFQMMIMYYHQQNYVQTLF